MQRFIGLFVICATALTACDMPTQSAVCKPEAYQYVESEFSIDYRAQAPSPIAEILSEGEVEFRNNAPRLVTLGLARTDQFQTIWRTQVTALLSRQIPDSSEEKTFTADMSFFRFNTPQMFQRLRTCTKSDDPRFGYIAALPRLMPVQNVLIIE
ncbi:hypothetical protein [Pseudaestuariivita rosea]|uniref:hypothetical protein n=1 Tax=Pseudaestuariivita rosea TaxID=2763263 RepID=UPI001ABAF15F|nr:hypothetical protein [Pseudaestuariivita rosea]